jgi:FAD synthase
MHNFDEDFYGQEIRAIALGYIRPEADFKSLGIFIMTFSTNTQQRRTDKGY